jgi:hypothetical protein
MRRINAKRLALRPPTDLASELNRRYSGGATHWSCLLTEPITQGRSFRATAAGKWRNLVMPQ